MIKGFAHTNITDNYTNLPTPTAEEANDGATAATIEALTYGIISIVVLIVATCLVAFIRRRKQRLALRAVDLEAQRQERRDEGQPHNNFIRFVMWVTGTNNSDDETSDNEITVEVQNGGGGLQVFDVNSRLEMGSAMTMGEPIYSSPLVPDPDGVFTIVRFSFTPITPSQGIAATGSRSPMQRSASAASNNSPRPSCPEVHTKRHRTSSICIGLPCNNVPSFVTPGALYGRSVNDSRLLSVPMQQFQCNNSIVSDIRPPSSYGEFCDISSPKDGDECCYPGSVFAPNDASPSDQN